ncbi:hypothetical protein [Streptomyces beihaiensis]|uniref:Uncharacterized protein n=1 Tax=Streptomyces beihaiensis TaxID=2984495 RepID=A0ABT3TX56_9ACTN|nr:hypothetical protein [Streptomyces beihaiensis]MCX3061626.1 hypothetical protein [Streptomyces beihaiensis]
MLIWAATILLVTGVVCVATIAWRLGSDRVTLVLPAVAVLSGFAAVALMMTAAVEGQ